MGINFMSTGPYFMKEKGRLRNCYTQETWA